jgi:integrase
VRGRTKTEVKDRLRTKHLELAAGVRAPARYTVELCLKDWLETLNTQAESTVTGYRIMVRHLAGLLGSVKLVELRCGTSTSRFGKLAKRLSTRSVRLARMILIQASRNAMVNDLVVRNVADLAAVPTGNAGRPSRSLNLEQALAVLDTAKGERLWPYVAVSMLGGIRTEEARALRWSEVDLEAGTVAVYRSVRRTGETTTEKSRRVFQIPEIAVEALRDLVLKQAAYRAKAGAAWKENDLVFCTRLARAAPHLRFAPVGFRRTHRADRGRGGPLEHPDNRGRVQAPAPSGYAYRCRRARAAVREQRKDQRRPN